MYSGSFLPEILIQNSSLDTVSSESLFDKKTVIYFWSQSQMNHYRKTLKILEEVKMNKPNYRFVGISIQPLNTMALQANMMLNKDNKNQFAIINFENASKKWIITLLNKAIVIDKNGKIINGFGNIFDSKFLNEL